MMNPMAKIIVNNVPKSFENENCIVYFSYKEGTKLLYLSVADYLFTDRVNIALNSSSLFGNVLSSISFIVIFTNFKFAASSNLKIR